MRTNFTIATLRTSACANLNQELLKEPVKKKRSKYGNEPIEFDGIRFASKKECSYYITLRARQTAGQISGLQTQVPFELNPGGQFSFKYVADFVWIENGQQIVCDTKGHKTKEFLKKERLMNEVYGIEIKIV